MGKKGMTRREVIRRSNILMRSQSRALGRLSVAIREISQLSIEATLAVAEYIGKDRELDALIKRVEKARRATVRTKRRSGTK